MKQLLEAKESGLSETAAADVTKRLTCLNIRSSQLINESKLGKRFRKERYTKNLAFFFLSASQCNLVNSSVGLQSCSGLPLFLYV